MTTTAPPAEVALIDPLARIDGRKAFFLRDNFGGEVPLGCPYPPLELAFTAAVLREAGRSVDLIAANVLGLEHDDVIARLRAAPPGLILIPSAWGSLPDDKRLLARLRDALPDTKLALSGPNVTAEHEAVLADSVADFVILGEPEEATLRLAEGVPAAEIPNLAYRGDGGVAVSERRPPPGWPTYPFPARDLLPLERYHIPFSRRLPSTTMATTRGCAHTCTFCPTQIWFRREVRARPVELVLAEVDELVGRYAMREVNIRDDTFTGDRERTVAICEGLIARGHDLTWRCFATVDTVDAELLALMARAGCVQVCYGFESGDDAILRKTGKRTTVAQGRDAIRWSRAAGLEISGTFLVGLEGETPSTVQASIDFAIEHELDYVQVNVATPLPATGFFKRQRRQGRASRPEAFRWSGAASGETEALAPDDLPRMARRFYRSFYVRPRYVAGRLLSRRGLRPLVAHARLGLRMARYLAEGQLR